MIIDIGQKIKAHREEKGVSQDDFARYLGVDCKDVIKWESGDRYPDFELIPIIANYFGTTTDELLCMEKFDNEDKIRGYTDGFSEKVAAGNIPGAVEAVREGLKHFPNEYRLKVLLMYGLYLSCDRPASVKHLSPELLSIGDDILSHCTEDPIRLEAKRLLCLHYCEDLEDTEKARQIAMTLPGRKSCREDMLTVISEGEAKLGAIQENISSYTSKLISALISYTESNRSLETKEKIKVLETGRTLRSMIYPDGDICEGAYLHMMLLRDLAILYAGERNNEKTLDCLAECAKCAADFDALPKVSSHTSPLVSRLRFSKQQLQIPSKNKKIPLRDIFLRDVVGLQCFDSVKYDDRMKEILGVFKK